MTLTAGSATILNRMNAAAKKVGMGTEIQRLGTANDVSVAASAAQTLVAGASGSATVSAAQASASRVIFTTGLTYVKGFIGQDRRSGSAVINAQWTSASAGATAGTIVVKSAVSASALPLAAGDSLYYAAW